MFVNSIDKKPFFTRPDGEILRDLTQTMFELKNRNYTSYEVYRVPEEYVMRPDLISKSVYNNSLYAEIILKYNGISNPFSIDAGDIILIPNLDAVKNNIKSPSKSIAESNADKLRKSYKYIDPIKYPKKSKELRNFDSRQIIQAKDGALPPNIAEEGTSQVTYRNGRVYFGEGVETCLKNGMTSSEFLTSIIKNKK